MKTPIPKPWWKIIGGIAIGVFGAWLLAVGISNFAFTAAFRPFMTRTTGEVVRRGGETGNGLPMYFLRVRYTASDGRTYEVDQKVEPVVWEQSPPGTSIEMLYKSRNPKMCEMIHPLDDPDAGWQVFLGILFLAAGVGVILWSVRDRDSSIRQGRLPFPLE